LADRNRRNPREKSRPAGQTGGRKSAKKEKVNLFPVAVAVAMLVLICWGFSGLMRMTQPSTGEEEPPMPMIGRQPEFFSTIRPETMNGAEVDVVDDPVQVSEYFANTLFVGDNWMHRLMNQRLDDAQVAEYLEKAMFLTNDYYSWDNVRQEFSGGELTLNLYGERVSLVTAAQKTGAKKVFIQLGRMDLIMEETDTALNFVRQSLTALHEALPNTEIVVFTMTPHYSESSTPPINAKIAKYNAGVKAMCTKESGITCIDLAALFPDDGLTEEFCADAEGAGTKLNAAGYLRVVNKLVDTVTSSKRPLTTPVPAATPAPTAAPTQPETTPPPQTAPTTNAPAAGRTPRTS